MVLYPHDLFGYEIVERNIGMGGFATVHLARCANGPVALKVPSMTDTKATMDDSVLDDFENETRIWKDLSDKDIKGIVKLFAYGSTPYPWMALEYMDRGTLNEVIGDLSAEESIDIASSLLETLYYAHHNGVIHRDIKPSNILVNSKGEYKLTDWGLGKALLTASVSTIGFKGTLQYSAPEQYNVKKFGVVDWRTDIFQMGAVIYHMLTGRPPVPNDLTEAMFLVVNGDIEPPHQVNPKISKRTSDVVMKALEVRKQHRWLDATSFRAALLGKEDATIKGLRVPDTGAGGFKGPESVYLNECPVCGNSIDENNKKLVCRDCQGAFCQTCSEWIDHIDEYRGRQIPRRTPLCTECSKRYYAGKKEEVDRQIAELERARTMKPVDTGEEYYHLVKPQNAVKQQRMWAEYMNVPIEWKNRSGIQFVLIPGGDFMMGSADRNNSRPVHRVRISSPFYLGKFPVTQEEWEKVMGKNPCRFRKEEKTGLFKKELVKVPDNPVETVSWMDVQEFIRNLNKLEGSLKYRLPTEAEWEYACRAGSEGRYCFGSRKSLLGGFAWFDTNAGGRVHEVGKLSPNEWDLHDVHGNIWEWCSDWYREDYYENSPEMDPKGPSEGTLKAARGGCYSYDGDFCGCGTRGFVAPEKRYDYLGFRLALSIY